MKTLFRSILLVLVAIESFGLEAAKVEGATPSKPPKYLIHERTAAEIVRMQDAGLDKVVLVAYIHNARVPYSATAEDIIFLHEHKVPEDVICEWINKSGSLIAAVAQTPARSPDLVAAYSRPAASVVQQQPNVYQTAPMIVAAPPVTYTSPTYVYSDYSYWSPAPVYFGFSYGWNRPYWSRPHYYGVGYHQGGWGGRWGGYHSGYNHFGGHDFGGSHAHFAGNFSGGGGHFRGGRHR